MGGPGGAATLDKRRDLRDELGYIAPPNRKLPPVPGTSYNTCDRIKRGTVISNFFFVFLIPMLDVSRSISKCYPKKPFDCMKWFCDLENFAHFRYFQKFIMKDKRFLVALYNLFKTYR